MFPFPLLPLLPEELPEEDLEPPEEDLEPPEEDLEPPDELTPELLDGLELLYDPEDDPLLLLPELVFPEDLLYEGLEYVFPRLLLLLPELPRL